MIDETGTSSIVTKVVDGKPMCIDTATGVVVSVQENRSCDVRGIVGIDSTLVINFPGLGWSSTLPLSQVGTVRDLLSHMQDAISSAQQKRRACCTPPPSP